MSSSIPFMCMLGVCFLLLDASTEAGECSAVYPSSCPDSTTLLQSRVQVDQEQEEDEAAAADVVHALSSDKSFTPPGFLIISSPSLKQVLWTVRQNMQTKPGRAFPLIDHGLDQPKGLAFDQKHGFLYVADSGAQKIFRYTLIIDKSGAKPHISTTHLRLTLVQNCGPVEWVTLDDAGNLFYSSGRTNNINKISVEVMRELASGELQASALTLVSEKTLQAEQIASRAKRLTSKNDALPTDPPPVVPHIYSIYEAKLIKLVARPGAICVDGSDLYWTNQENGVNAGTVVQGLVWLHFLQKSLRKSAVEPWALPKPNKPYSSLGTKHCQAQQYPLVRPWSPAWPWAPTLSWILSRVWVVPGACSGIEGKRCT